MDDLGVLLSWNTGFFRGGWVVSCISKMSLKPYAKKIGKILA
jgi:hypothetical protein